MKSGFCVLWGRPNVGKSTLLNAMMGRKHVIVSPRPQTTRHRITGVLNHVAPEMDEENEEASLTDEEFDDEYELDGDIDEVVEVVDGENEFDTDDTDEVEEIDGDEDGEDEPEPSEFDLALLGDLSQTSAKDVIGEYANLLQENQSLDALNTDYQIVFLDTPGIHEPQHKLGEALVKNAKGALGDIECVVFVADSTDKPHNDDRRAAELLKNIKVPVLLALNKSDAGEISAERIQEFQALYNFDATFPISALKENGLDALKAAIVDRLPEGDPYFPPDMLSDRPIEFHIEELIREQAMLQLREEVPHSVAVGVEIMEPRKNGTLFLEAFIHVERDSQKRIVIGAGGSRIKEIGQKARQEIEALLGRPVYLELRVKVRDKWRDNEMWIQRLGYSEN